MDSVMIHIIYGGKILTFAIDGGGVLFQELEGVVSMGWSALSLPSQFFYIPKFFFNIDYLTSNVYL